ncbi:MAG: ABC-three component system protein [bacterium]
MASFENSPNETAKVGEKIDYNSLTNFKDAILAYPEYYALIDGIIVDLSKEKFLARRVLYDRVKDIYKECKAESDDNNKIMTDMVSKLYEDYKDNELEVDGAILVDE